MKNHKNNAPGFPAILIFITTACFCWGASLQQVGTIGSEKENYTFHRISGAVMAPNQDIYVLDGKGNFLARYNPGGHFIKRIGRQGQGPGEFSMPRYLDILGNTLYLMDGGNVRIAEVNLELDQTTYYRLYDGMPFLNNFFALDENRFIGGSFGVNKNNEFNGIRIVDVNSGRFTFFFNHTPANKHKKIDPTSKNSLAKSFFFLPMFGMDPTRKQILVTFFQPDNPIMFYLYTVEGQYLDSFSHSVEKKYRFPSYFLDHPVRYPPISHVPLVLGVFWHDNRYIVFLSLVKYRRKYPDEKSQYCLIFDGKTRKLSDRFEVAKDLEPFFLSRDGHLLATRVDDLIPRLYIYKLHL